MYNSNNGFMNWSLEQLVTVTLCNATRNSLFVSSNNVRLYSKPFKSTEFDRLKGKAASDIQYCSKVSYHHLARRVSFLARRVSRRVSRETRCVSFLGSALEVPIRERIDHQTLTRFLFTLVHMRNDALITKPRLGLTFYSNL